MKERRDKYHGVTQAYLCLVDKAENSIIVVLWASTILQVISQHLLPKRMSMWTRGNTKIVFYKNTNNFDSKVLNGISWNFTGFWRRKVSSYCVNMKYQYWVFLVFMVTFTHGWFWASKIKVTQYWDLMLAQ